MGDGEEEDEEGVARRGVGGRGGVGGKEVTLSPGVSAPTQPVVVSGISSTASHSPTKTAADAMPQDVQVSQFYYLCWCVCACVIVSVCVFCVWARACMCACVSRVGGKCFLTAVSDELNNGIGVSYFPRQLRRGHSS